MKKLFILMSVIFLIILTGCQAVRNTDIQNTDDVNNTTISNENQTPNPDNGQIKDINNQEETKYEDIKSITDNENILNDETNTDAIYSENYFLCVGSGDRVSDSNIEGIPYIKYLINTEDIHSEEDYEIDLSSVIPNDDNFKIVRISESKERILVINNSQLDVIEIPSEKVIYSLKCACSSPDMIFQISTDLNYLIYQDGEHLYLINIDKKIKAELPNSYAKLSRKSMLFSPDNTKIAFITDKYSSIDIYDLSLMKSINKFFLDDYGVGKELIQWSKSNKILYSFGNRLYMVNSDGSGNIRLGSYMFSAVLSPDGEYLAYYRGGSYDGTVYGDIPGFNSEYGYDLGLFIIDLKTNQKIKMPHALYPIQWIGVDNRFLVEGNRIIDKVDNSIQYKLKNEIISSSYLSEDGIIYRPENAYDGDISTAWVEDGSSSPPIGDGTGIDEWIKLTQLRYIEGSSIEYEVEKVLTGIDLINGYAKSESAYFANNRVKEIKIIFSDGSSMTKELEDNSMLFQRIDFAKPIPTKSVTIQIMDIYKGEKYNDTCISEIKMVEADSD